MKIQIKGTALKPKEILAVIERVLRENNISNIDNLSLYFNSSNKTVVITSLHKSEIDIDSREQEGFDQLSF